MRISNTTSKEIEWVKLYVDGSQRESFGPEKLVSTTITLDNNKTYELKGVVRTKDGQEKDTVLKIGVGVEWDFAPSPTASPSATP